ncbi:uncharacterized protein EI90DRAFT_3127766 [Cantharellus anzutake]|uniref:uncharacterized protein n=1 Tax=Cantharellus anzutake TaxID=1750568 RepID=UPI001904F32B|nr:uncharacterized protein EI90DRAFT_3127766 [Cantharellus anzutake]KAF8326567.1 hypothetical protein EI90DRAFT_3127766 [Cantharellus anzutake]
MTEPSAADVRAVAVAKLKRAASLPRMKDGRRPPMHDDAVSEGDKSNNPAPINQPVSQSDETVSDGEQQPQWEASPTIVPIAAPAEELPTTSNTTVTEEEPPPSGRDTPSKINVEDVQGRDRDRDPVGRKISKGRPLPNFYAHPTHLPRNGFPQSRFFLSLRPRSHHTSPPFNSTTELFFRHHPHTTSSIHPHHPLPPSMS